MKKLVVLMLCVVMALAVIPGCSAVVIEPTPAKSVTEIYSAIESETQLPDMMSLEDDYINAYYGIDVSLLSEYCFTAAVEVMDVTTVFLARVADPANMQTVVDSLNNLRAMRMTELESYAPELYEIVKGSSAKTEGDFIYMVISEDADAINAVIEKNI